jgi:hypothetical protein
MIPILCDGRFYFPAGAQLDCICVANECGGKNKAANGAQQISIHAINTAITDSARNDRGKDVTIQLLDSRISSLSSLPSISIFDLPISAFQLLHCRSLLLRLTKKNELITDRLAKLTRSALHIFIQ